LELKGERGSHRHASPAWLVQFIDNFSQRFEPFSGVARVGYECQKAENGWEVAIFLGEHEIVGGAADGQLRPINFRFDLKNIDAEFDQLSTISWNAFPSSHVCLEMMADLSFLTIEGIVHGEHVRLQLHAGPPDSIGPAIREHVDGRLELV
jgi:hypothetical protein